MIPKIGPVELIIILVIVTMLFGVGRLPEVFGSIGRGVREFRRNAEIDDDNDDDKKSKQPTASADETSVESTADVEATKTKDTPLTSAPEVDEKVESLAPAVPEVPAEPVEPATESTEKA